MRSLRASRWAISTVFCLNGIGIGLWSAHIPLVQERTGIDPKVLSAVLFVIAAGAIGSMSLCGLLVDRFGSRRVTGCAALAFVAITPILVGSAGVSTLFVAALAFGAANGGLDVAMNANAAEWESAEGRPAMSSFHAFFSLGGMGGAALAGLLISREIGGALGASVVTALALLVLLAAMPGLLVGGATAVAAAHFALPRRGALALGVLALLCMMVEGALVDWSALLLRERTQVGAAEAAFGYSAFSIAMAAGRLTGDVLVTRLGARSVMMFGGLSMALGLSMAVSVRYYAGAVAGFALVGLGAANVVPLIFGAAARIPGMSAGIGVATTASVGYAGFLLGPPLIGWVASLTSLSTSLGLLALAGLAIALNARAIERIAS
jgi:MFS family permease